MNSFYKDPLSVACCMYCIEVLFLAGFSKCSDWLCQSARFTQISMAFLKPFKLFVMSYIFAAIWHFHLKQVIFMLLSVCLPTVYQGSGWISRCVFTALAIAVPCAHSCSSARHHLLRDPTLYLATHGLALINDLIDENRQHPFRLIELPIEHGHCLFSDSRGWTVSGTTAVVCCDRLSGLSFAIMPCIRRISQVAQEQSAIEHWESDSDWRKNLTNK